MLSNAFVSRAPELIFGATDYTTNIDVWSAGCVFAGKFLLFLIFFLDNLIRIQYFTLCKCEKLVINIYETYCFQVAILFL